MAVELEVAELLYALVRAAKPRFVVEAGAGRGIASRFIAEALKANGVGELLSYDHDPEYVEKARLMLQGLPAKVFLGVSSQDGYQPDMVFIDSLGGEIRDRDLAYWFGRGIPLIVVHDANRYDLPGGVKLKAGRGVWIGR